LQYLLIISLSKFISRGFRMVFSSIRIPCHVPFTCFDLLIRSVRDSRYVYTCAIFVLGGTTYVRRGQCEKAQRTSSSSITIPDQPPRAVRAPPPEPETIIAGRVMLAIPAAACRHYQIRSVIIVTCYCQRASATPVRYTWPS
jgi:hypothetical protein